MVALALGVEVKAKAEEEEEESMDVAFEGVRDASIGATTLDVGRPRALKEAGKDGGTRNATTHEVEVAEEVEVEAGTEDIGMGGEGEGKSERSCDEGGDSRPA